MTDKSSTVRQHFRPVIQDIRPKIRNKFNPKFAPDSKRRRFILPNKQDDTEQEES